MEVPAHHPVQRKAVLWIRIRIRNRIGSGFNGGSWICIRMRNPDPDTRGQKWPRKKEKLINFIFWSAGCSLLRAEGLFLQFLIEKIKKLFFCHFGHQNPGSVSGFMNPDPQHCRNVWEIKITSKYRMIFIWPNFSSTWSLCNLQRGDFLAFSFYVR